MEPIVIFSSIDKPRLPVKTPIVINKSTNIAAHTSSTPPNQINPISNIGNQSNRQQKPLGIPDA
jgi:hypothetical protein